MHFIILINTLHWLLSGITSYSNFFDEEEINLNTLKNGNLTVNKSYYQ